MKTNNTRKRSKNKITVWLRRIGIGLAAFIAIVLFVLVLIDGTFLPKKYLEPWTPSYAQQFSDPRLQVIAHGLLAPNPHNQQSWKIRLDQEHPLTFTLFVDSERLLPVSDPFSRQITMGQGTFLENASIGAAKLGYTTRMVLFPDGEFDAKGTPASMDTHPVARVTLEKTTAEDHSLYDALTRATSKAKLLANSLTPEEIQSLQRLNSDPDLTVLIFQDENRVEKIKQLTIEGMAIDLKHSLPGESHLFHFTEWQKNKHRSGLTVAPFGFPKIQQFFMQALGAIIPVSEETTINIGLSGFKESIALTPAYLLILSRGNTRTVQVQAGMLYSRLEHTGTVMGLTMQPAEQVLQEYLEMTELYKEVHNTFANPDQTIQMLAGMGKSEQKVSHSPRRDVHALIIK